jgi:NAD(P)-dependent dehydrogenase (short-subunit alcohol dehydrogenase family)
MAREWAADGVTVNTVAPGYTETELTREYLARPGMREEMAGLVPAGRLGPQPAGPEDQHPSPFQTEPSHPPSTSFIL